MGILATSGNVSDFLKRLKGVEPRGWFGNDSPISDAVLSGAAAGLSANYTMLAYVAKQTRIKTATGPFLDLISEDFFHGALPRNPNESDTNFRARILSRLFQSGPARRNLVSVITQITGTANRALRSDTVRASIAA